MNINYNNKQLRAYYTSDDREIYHTYNTLYLIIRGIFLRVECDYIDIFPNINKL